MSVEPAETINLRQLRTATRQGDTDVVPMPRMRMVPSTWTANLVQIGPSGPGLGRRHAIEAGSATLGRDAQCSLQIIDGSVSRLHAHIEPRTEGGYRLSDLNSRNGTFVNGNRITSSDLKDGDYVQLGECVFRFLAGDNVEAGYHDEIRRLTLLDALTGVHNRRSLDEFLERETSRSARHGSPLAVIIIDLDHFKQVNDRYGHPIGDGVLRSLAGRLRHLARAEDLVARYGGEEFALVLPETELRAAVSTGERIRHAIEETPFECEGRSICLTASIGAAVLDPNLPASAKQLLQTADERLYLAKRGGRNRVEPAPTAETELTATMDANRPGAGTTREVTL